MIRKRNVTALVLTAAVLISAGALWSQAVGVDRKAVKTADVSVSGREGIVASVTIAVDGRTGKHTHPGDELSYVLEGNGEILVDGQPTIKVKAGDGFIIPGGTKHDAHNTGSAPMKLVVVYHVEKGKPLATPVQ